MKEKTDKKKGRQNSDLEIIKRLLVVQLIESGVSMRDVLKIAKMSSATLYKFMPEEMRKK